MAAGAIRGSRIGSGPMGESERGDAAPRQVIDFNCSQGHVTSVAFAVEVELPEAWDCQRCGGPATVDSSDAPEPLKTEPYKTHLAYAKERRSDEDAAALLEEALATLRSKRKSGEIVF